MEQNLFTHHSHRFMQWLNDTPTTRVSSKIALEDFRARGAGRGVGVHATILYVGHLTDSSTVALADIAEDEELFATPRTLVLSIQTSDLQSHLSISIKELGPWLGLILVMLYEYLKGEKSRWNSYFL